MRTVVEVILILATLSLAGFVGQWMAADVCDKQGRAWIAGEAYRCYRLEAE